MTITSTGVTTQIGVPTFQAYLNSNQTVTKNTWTKVQCNTEEWDTASAYDNTTNYRFQPTVAGYYQVTGNFSVEPSATTFTRLLCGLYKNGSEYKFEEIVAAPEPSIKFCPLGHELYVATQTS